MAQAGIRFLNLTFITFLMLIAAPAFGDEVRHVHNGATPRDGTTTMRVEELWRAGDDSDDIFFGRASRVDTDRNGNVYIFDAQLCQVHIYSPDGDHLRTVFREGDGPGEVRGPRDMLLMPDGSVGLILESMGIIRLVDADGSPGTSLRMGIVEGGNYNLMTGAGTDNAMVIAGRSSSPGESNAIRLRRNFLVRSDLEGNETAVYAERQTVYDFNEFSYVERDELLPFQWSFDVGSDGRVFAVVNRDKYEVTVYDSTGKPDFVIEREYAPFSRTKEDRERFATMIETSMEAMPFDTSVEMEATYPAISVLHRGIQVTCDGFLWVLSGRGLYPETPGIMAVFDVFDPSGIFVRQVALAAPHDASRVGIVLAEGNRVIVIKGFLESLASQFGNGANFIGEEWSTPEVIVYQMSAGNQMMSTAD